MPLSFFKPKGRFEQLVHQHQHRVYGLACYLLGDRDEAADVAQDVFLRLWTHRSTVDEERALGWLLRVTRNACIDALRKRRTAMGLFDVDTERAEQAPALGPAPDMAAEAADFSARLRNALDQLREPYRSIVILREIQELKYEEISGAMDLPMTTVKVYLHRGRKMLRDRLSEVMEREVA